MTDKTTNIVPIVLLSVVSLSVTAAKKDGQKTIAKTQPTTKSLMVC